MGYTYPTTPIPAEGYSSDDEYATLIAGPYLSGRALTGKGREYPVFRARLRYLKVTQSDIAPILTLFRNVRGRYNQFTYFDFAGHDNSPVGVAWEDLYVGVGDGVTTGFDLPMKSATNRTVKVNGSTTTAYTFSSAGGPDGRDKITFTVAPTSGHIIELSATGQRAVYARFATDVLQIVRYSAGLLDLDVAIEEAR